MSASSLRKTFLFLSILAIFACVYILKRSQNVAWIYDKTKTITNDVQNVSSNSLTTVIHMTDNTVISDSEISSTAKSLELKYILQYTRPQNVPFVYMGVGQEGFKSNKCPHTNCFVTGDPNYLGNVTKFDVVAFIGTEVIYMHKFPKERAPHQKYVFANIESSHYYPICSNRLDGFFNWTWTFRLDSDVRWGYLDIWDVQKNVIIGPNKIMHWMKVEDMDPVSEGLKEKLKSKTLAGAWFVSNCMDKSGRLKFAKDLQVELKKYNLALDIFGKCGDKFCSTSKHDECMKMVDKSYYFYMSFENSFSEDYVTEKLLQALKIDVVPVVYGGANYTRFMPDGIYLNARELGPAKLAAKMAALIKNPDEYANYFKWKKYYSYRGKHDLPETNEYCKMCELLNDEEKLKKTSIIQNFREWWDSPNLC